VSSSKEEPPGPQPVPRSIPQRLQDRVRRQQIIGILLVAVAILIFTLLRADWHNLFPTGWWRW
jgi:hypothetical protein